MQAMNLPHWIPLLATLVLAGCASSPTVLPAPARTAPTPTLAVPQAAPPLLAAEKHWLEDLFRDTPVTVAAAPDAGVRVQVPLKYSFDPGQDLVKPPLAAVLDKVAASLRRQPRAQLRVAAPAGVRAENVRQQLLKRGVAAVRIAPLVARGDAVELQMWVPPV